MVLSLLESFSFAAVAAASSCSSARSTRSPNPSCSEILFLPWNLGIRRITFSAASTSVQSIWWNGWLPSTSTQISRALPGVAAGGAFPVPTLVGKAFLPGLEEIPVSEFLELEIKIESLAELDTGAFRQGRTRRVREKGLSIRMRGSSRGVAGRTGAISWRHGGGTGGANFGSQRTGRSVLGNGRRHLGLVAGSLDLVLTGTGHLWFGGRGGSRHGWHCHGSRDRYGCCRHGRPGAGGCFTKPDSVMAGRGRPARHTDRKIGVASS